MGRGGGASDMAVFIEEVEMEDDGERDGVRDSGGERGLAGDNGPDGIRSREGWRGAKFGGLLVMVVRCSFLG